MSQEELNSYHNNNVYLYDVLDILVEHFGEERVSFTEPGPIVNNGVYQVIIHYPEVRVTNEYDRYIDIQDLYVKIAIYGNGTIVNTGNSAMQMIRSTFNKEQYINEYTHSHIPRSGMCVWSNPCFGQGPIKSTINQLHLRFDDMLWGILCNELDTWTEVESIAGVPHYKMETIGLVSGSAVRYNREYWGNDYHNEYSIFGEVTSKNILIELIKNPELKFSYNGQWDLSLSDNRFALIASNAALKIIENLHLSQSEVSDILRFNFNQCILVDGVYRKPDNTPRRIDNADLITPLLYFKGNAIKLKITNLAGEESSSNLTYILKSDRLSTLYKQIVKLVNSLYGKPIVEGRTRIL